MKTRKLICILLSVVLILGLSNSSLVFASDNTSDDESVDAGLSATADNAFYAPTIRQMIDVNLELGNQDEEFYHALANAYLASPSLLAETISDLPAADIQYLAKAISYDLHKTNRVDLAVVPNDCNDAVSSAVARLIYREANNTDNMSLDSFANMPVLEEQILSTEEIMLLNNVVAYSATPVSSTATVNSILRVNVSFGSGLAATYARQYVVKLYKNDGTTTSLARTQNATILAGDVNGSSTVRVSFSKTGVYTFYAELYDTSGNLLSTTPVSSSVTVSGNWRINVVLKEDRDQKGTLYLYDAGGNLRISGICLGRSVSNAATNVYRGNTPTGECTGYLYGPYPASEQGSFGPYKTIALTPVSGDIYDSGRGPFMIHGGNNDYVTENMSYYPLEPTHGCIRIENDFQLLLQQAIERMISTEYHNTTGNISIIEE
jgi:hypothetical protein